MSLAHCAGPMRERKSSRRDRRRERRWLRTGEDVEVPEVTTRRRPMTAARSYPTAATAIVLGMLAMLGCVGSELGHQADNSKAAVTTLAGPLKRYMYAGAGTTLKVYDMDDGHRLVKTITLPHATGQITGIVAN